MRAAKDSWNDRGSSIRPPREAESLRDELWSLDAEYEAATGKTGILYVSRPGDGSARYVFSDGEVRLSKASAVLYLKKLLGGLGESG